MRQLRKATEAVGGWDEAMAVAKARRVELDQATRRSDDEAFAMNGSSTPSEYSSTSSSSAHNGDATLRRRMNASSSGTADTMPSAGIVTTGNHVLQEDETIKPGPHPLVEHPDERISALAREFSELDSELVSTGPLYVRWPNNISYKSFAEYMLIPTLVYELEYPRTDRSVVNRNEYVSRADKLLVEFDRCTSLKRRWRRSAHSHFYIRLPKASSSPWFPLVNNHSSALLSISRYPS